MFGVCQIVYSGCENLETTQEEVPSDHNVVTVFHVFSSFGL